MWLTLGSIKCQVLCFHVAVGFKNFLMLLQSAWDSSPLFPCWAQAHFPFTVSSPTIPTWWPCIWEKAAWSFWLHSVSKIPASSACIPQPPLILSTAQLSSVELVFISLEILPWMVCHHLPLKSFLLLSSNNDGAKSHPKLTPYWLFPQYFTENTKQKCHFTRGVFFFLLECKLLQSRDNVFCMFYCA